MGLARLDSKGSSDIGKFGGHFRLVHVDADADHGVMNAVWFGVHFGEDAGKFSSTEKQIVGPADIQIPVKVLAMDFLCARIASGEASYESEKRRVSGWNLRT